MKRAKKVWMILGGVVIAILSVLSFILRPDGDCYDAIDEEIESIQDEKIKLKEKIADVNKKIDDIKEKIDEPIEETTDIDEAVAYLKEKAHE